MGKEIILFIWYHHSNEILFQVNILDSPIGPEEIIHHIQICDLNKTCQLVLDRCVRKAGSTALIICFLSALLMAVYCLKKIGSDGSSLSRVSVLERSPR